MAPKDRSDQLGRIDDTAEALSGLGRALDDSQPLGVSLDRLATLALMIIPHANAVTISALNGGHPRTEACTDEQFAAIDTRQYDAGRGPCLHAARTRQPVRATVAEQRGTWPEFVDTAEDMGVQAYLSIPLIMDSKEPELVGSFNLYSTSATAFDPFDEHLMRLFSTAAVEAINIATRWQHAQEKVRHLEIALRSRAEIDQAIGILMAVHRCTADEAFAELSTQSQHSNIKVRDIARQLLQRATQSSNDRSDR